MQACAYLFRSSARRRTEMSSARPPLIFYVDVDDTLVRYAGSKRMPIPNVVAHVRRLNDASAVLYCWSANGADYARTVAQDLGIESCFAAFLPKPNVMIDDQEVGAWKRFICVHPFEVDDEAIDSYSVWVAGGTRK
jgi:hypothetical protein